MSAISAPWLWARATARLNVARVASFACCLAAVVGPIRPRPDTDTWWHLATGEWILAHGRIPATDPFSWTAAGKPWVAHEWGSEVLFALVDRLAGPGGLLVFSGIFVGAAFLLLRRTVYLVTDNDWIVAAALAVALFLSTLTWSVRPHLFSLLFLSVFLYQLVAYRFRGWSSSLWSLTAIAVVWANLHAAFLAGILLLWVFAVISLIERHESATSLAKVAFVTTIASVINPSGFAVYPFAFHVATVGATYIQEWQPPSLRDPYGITFACIALGTPLLLAATNRRADRALLLAAAIFSVAGFAAVKNVWVAGMLGAPALAAALHAWGRIPTPDPSTGRERSVLVAVQLLLVAAGVAVVGRGLASWTQAEMRGEQAFPAAASEALDALPPGRVANPYDWGGYLIWKRPDARVSVDGRADMYGSALMRDLATLERLAPGWRDFLEANDVDYVLWQTRGPLAEALRLAPEWQIVYEDDQAIVFQRAAEGG